MPQSYFSMYVHLVFGTKQRHPYLAERPLRTELHRYLGGTSKALGCSPVAVGGVEDHVHVLAELGRQVTVSAWVRELKKSSTEWTRLQGPAYSSFSWQVGYGCFTVGNAAVGAVAKYIETQEEHHRRLTFEEQYRALLAEHGIPHDERYPVGE